MPTKNFLSSETKETLQQALKDHEHPDIRQRALIFLLLNNGNTQAQTAELIGCSLRKVAYWSVHGDPENLDSFKDNRMKGNYRGDLRAEWILQGNLAEDFEDKGCKFVIILDNASFHKKAETLQKIASEMPNLIIEFLPKYSPDYNLVELVWHSTKEYVANRLFESIEKLESLLHKLLNEGGLIMKWNRKIKNKGNLINAV